MATYRLEPDIAVAGDLSPGDPAQRKRDLLLLGKLSESGAMRRLWLDVSGEQVVAVFGKRGTGKSYTLGVILEGLAAGSGGTPIAVHSTPRAGLVLDLMDIYWTSQIPLTGTGPPEVQKQFAAMKAAGYSSQPLNVDVWLPAGFEKPKVDPPGTSELFIAASELELDDWAAMFGVDIFGEPRGMLIADAVTHVRQTGYTRQDGSSVAALPQFGVQELLTALDDDADIIANYRPDTIRSVRQRLTTYGQLPLFRNPGTPLVSLLRPNRVSVVMLARVPDALKKVLTAVLLRRIMRDRRDAALAQKRLDLDTRVSPEEAQRLTNVVQASVPRTWVLLDEAHVLAGAAEDSVSKDALIKYAKEGRQVGLSLAIATQQPSALDPRLTSQVETLLVHQVTAPHDAAVASQNMRSPPPTKILVDGTEVSDAVLFRRLGQGLAVFSCGNAPILARPVVLAVRPRISAHGGYEA